MSARALAARLHPLALQPALRLSPERTRFGTQTGILFAAYGVGQARASIPRWGVTAAAAVTVITAAVVLALTLSFLLPLFRREGRRPAHAPAAPEVGRG